MRKCFKYILSVFVISLFCCLTVFAYNVPSELPDMPDDIQTQYDSYPYHYIYTTSTSPSYLPEYLILCSPYKLDTYFYHNNTGSTDYFNVFSSSDFSTSASYSDCLIIKYVHGGSQDYYAHSSSFSKYGNTFGYCGSMGGSDVTMHYSDNNISQDGSVFFSRLIPFQSINQMVQAHRAEIVQPRTFSILAVCLIALITSIVAFLTFRKIFSRF